MHLLKTKAFTLTELLVWITIISVLIVWVTKIDFNRLSQKQRLEIFINKVKTNFEITRNNFLSWKWIWANLEVPDSWRIEYSKVNSWTIVTTHSGTTITESSYIDFVVGSSITSIKCWWLNEVESNFDELEDTWTWIITFKWWKITLTRDWDLNCDSTDKILQIWIKHYSNTWTIKINTLNWLVEIN